jgi:hypothetical protein
MPPVTLHMVLARNLAQGAGLTACLERPGAYLLGSTTPDIRVITRQDRYSTHFFDLNVHEHQDSVDGFFREHGRLVERELLNPDTQAFVAGYVSHLVLDEQYITGMYRPYFAHHDSLGGAVRADVMDRLLQFDLDRIHGSDPQLRQQLNAALSFTVDAIDVGFVEAETLERWRQVTIDVSQRNMDWERMRGMIANHLRYRAGLEQGEALGEFLDSLPELLDETIAHITSAEVSAFIERSTEAALTAVKRYLGCG